MQWAWQNSVFRTSYNTEFLKAAIIFINMNQMSACDVKCGAHSDEIVNLFHITSHLTTQSGSSITLWPTHFQGQQAAVSGKKLWQTHCPLPAQQHTSKHVCQTELLVLWLHQRNNSYFFWTHDCLWHLITLTQNGVKINQYRFNSW